MRFLPSQSVNDLRYNYSATHSPTGFLPMTYVQDTYGPGASVGALSNTPSAVVWD